MKVKSESEVSRSCPTLSDLMDCSPPGSSVHGIFQARVLEWVASAFSNILVYKYSIAKKEEKVKDPMAPLSMEFSKQEYWRGLPFPSPRDLPYPVIEPRFPTLQTDSLLSEPPGKTFKRDEVLFHIKLHTKKETILIKPIGNWDFPSSPMVGNLPCNAGDTSSLPGPGTKTPQAAEQLRPRTA